MNIGKWGSIHHFEAVETCFETRKAENIQWAKMDLSMENFEA